MTLNGHCCSSYTRALRESLQKQLDLRVGGPGVSAHVGLLWEAQPTDGAGEGSLPCVGVHVVFKMVTLAKQPLTNWARVAQPDPSSSSSALQEKPTRPHSQILQSITTTITVNITTESAKVHNNGLQPPHSSLDTATRHTPQTPSSAEAAALNIHLIPSPSNICKLNNFHIHMTIIFFFYLCPEKKLICRFGL